MDGRGALIGAAVLALVGCGGSQQPTVTDLFVERIERLDAGDANLIREFGIPEFHARTLEAARRIWIEEGGRPEVTPGAVTYQTRLPAGSTFDRYDLYRSVDANGQPSWTGRWVHLRRVSVTDAASRAFPLDAVWQAYQRHGRNGAAPAFQAELARLTPDPEQVARGVLTRVETTDSRSCPALARSAEQAVALAAERSGGEAGSNDATNVLTIRRLDGGETVLRGGAATALSGGWYDAFWRGTANCWRLQTINNPENDRY